MGETPQTLTFHELSAFCKQGPRPRYLTGALRCILIAQFSSADHIEQEQLKDYLWNEDPKQTKILIESVQRWDITAIQQRPALLLKLNRCSTQALGINDGIPMGITSDEAWAGEAKVVTVIGSHTVFVIGETGAEAEALGQEVFQNLMEFGPVIRKDLNLARFTVVEMGAVAKLEESKEHWVVPIACGWAYFNAWRLYPLAPFIKTIAISTEDKS